jgi:NADH:ubiquinone oxidoreductase subunit 5 (subunit L)/multisubunit Na+/H+ antiporter MnhA subunit
MSTQTAPWIILFTPLVSAALILLLGKFSKTLSASLALIAAGTGCALSWWLFNQPIDG